MKRSKRYKEAVAKTEFEKEYDYMEGIALVKEMSAVKFDESVDMAFRLNIQQKHSIRGSISLPNSVSAVDKKVLVFAEGEKAKEAEEAGAAFVGSTELIDKIKGGWLEFDVAIATPEMMKNVGKLGPILGKRGLMPNPKVGTVTQDLKTAVLEFKKGKVEYRADKTGIVHMRIGKISMDVGKIAENGKLIFKEIMKKKPSDIKGEYVKSVSLTTTMGPGIRVEEQTIK